jgi:hypothetical protein
MKSTLTPIIATLLCLVAVAVPKSASAYSAAGDFSISSNPNGAWSYGWSMSLGSAFNLDTTNTANYNGLGVDGWLSPGGLPYILYNNTTNTVVNQNSTYQPGQLILQPDTTNDYGIVRWTAPSSGLYNITATFSGVSSLGDSVDVHILDNGSSIFDSTVTGSPSPTSYSGIQNLAAGATIDFAVGNGGNGPNEDNTALSATIQSVPEPSTVALTTVGLLGLLGYRKRK